MWIVLQEVREHGGSCRIEKDFESKDLHLDPRIARIESPARVDLRVELRGDFVRVRGQLKASLQVICSRCLEETGREISKKIDLEYRPDPLVENDGEEFELDYKELSVGFYRDDRIDLTALVDEQLILEVPMKPVCREECKGLCPNCGTNRNEEECGCRTDRTDPRLAVLAELKQRLN